MNQNQKQGSPPLTTELLILSDGQILVHNLTQPFTELLAKLNPDCEQIASRVIKGSPLPTVATHADTHP
jgi:hypothetical protein